MPACFLFNLHFSSVSHINLLLERQSSFFTSLSFDETLQTLICEFSSSITFLYAFFFSFSHDQFSFDFITFQLCFQHLCSFEVSLFDNSLYRAVEFQKVLEIFYLVEIHQLFDLGLCDKHFSHLIAKIETKFEVSSLPLQSINFSPILYRFSFFFFLPYSELAPHSLLDHLLGLLYFQLSYF
mgnify:CR=1 FL=1